jgi:hypothetical protein
MRKFFHQHRHLAGYLMIVAVAVLAVELHHWQTTSEINRASHEACHDAEIVSRNQRLVLSYLIDFNLALGNSVAELVAARAQVPQVFCR